MTSSIAGIRAVYVYGLVADRRRPARRRRGGIPAAGPVRLIELPWTIASSRTAPALRVWLAVADVPLDVYNEPAIERRLHDLDWLSRLAMAHETVVESFSRAAALLPVKLFTIYTADDRAVADLRRRRTQIDAALLRVLRHQEWGVRVARAADAPSAAPASRAVPTGAAYLQHKRAQRHRESIAADASRRLAGQLFRALSREVRASRRRTARQLGAAGGPLLLDAVFLVPRVKARAFAAAVRQQGRPLERIGCRVVVTGPWPPYSFVQR
jgi:hypothetical protein